MPHTRRRRWDGWQQQHTCKYSGGWCTWYGHQLWSGWHRGLKIKRYQHLQYFPQYHSHTKHMKSQQQQQHNWKRPHNLTPQCGWASQYMCNPSRSHRGYYNRKQKNPDTIFLLRALMDIEAIRKGSLIGNVHLNSLSKTSNKHRANCYYIKKRPVGKWRVS